MNLSEWRQARQQGTEATLPSGLTVTLKQVSLLDLASSGRIPQTLIAPVNELINKGQSSTPTLDDLTAMGPVVDLVVRAALVGPDGLTVEELPFSDKLAIFEWCNAEAQKLSTFRQG